MDIPQVLGTICPEKYWGSMANSSCTYEQFAAHWPKENGPVPSKEEMETVWKQIQRVPKSKEEIEQDVNTWIGENFDNLKKMMVALSTDCLQNNPHFFEKFGIPISGDRKPR